MKVCCHCSSWLDPLFWNNNKQLTIAYRVTYPGSDNIFKQRTLLLPCTFCSSSLNEVHLWCVCVYALGTVINAKREVQITHRMYFTLSGQTLVWPFEKVVRKISTNLQT